MARTYRSLAGIALALMLALTSGAMAVARGQTHAAGQVVLCTGSGPVTVAVDADGQPIGPAHICPDCALGFFAAVSEPPGVPGPAPVAGEPLRPAVEASRASRPLHAARARAPPLS